METLLPASSQSKKEQYFSDLPVLESPHPFPPEAAENRKTEISAASRSKISLSQPTLLSPQSESDIPRAASQRRAFAIRA
jgi:hypothetical protein